MKLVDLFFDNLIFLLLLGIA